MPHEPARHTAALAEPAGTSEVEGRWRAGAGRIRTGARPGLRLLDRLGADLDPCDRSGRLQTGSRGGQRWSRRRSPVWRVAGAARVARLTGLAFSARTLVGPPRVRRPALNARNGRPGCRSTGVPLPDPFLNKSIGHGDLCIPRRAIKPSQQNSQPRPANHSHILRAAFFAARPSRLQAGRGGADCSWPVCCPSGS